MAEECLRAQSPIRAAKILRTSIHTFLSYWHHFTFTPALLALPFSVSLLALPTSLSPLFLPQIHLRLRSLFFAAGFPSSSDLFSLLSLKLSEILFSAILTLPFSLSFLLLAKSAVIQSLTLRPHQSPLTSPFFPLLLTQVCCWLVLLAAHSTCFSLFTFVFTAANFAANSALPPTWVFFISAAGALFYSIMVANAIVVCNLGLIISGCESRGGFMPILKACVMLRGKTSTALALAVPSNMAMVAGEWLFRYRVVNSDPFRPAWVLAGEGLLIGYLYSVLVVVDVIVGCFFYQSCKDAASSREIYHSGAMENNEEEEEQMYKEYGSDLKKLRALEQGISV